MLLLLSSIAEQHCKNYGPTNPRPKRKAHNKKRPEVVKNIRSFWYNNTEDSDKLYYRKTKSGVAARTLQMTYASAYRKYIIENPKGTRFHVSRPTFMKYRPSNVKILYLRATLLTCINSDSTF